MVITPFSGVGGDCNVGGIVVASGLDDGDPFGTAGDNVLDEDYETFGTFGEVDEVDLAEVPGADNPRMLGPGRPRSFSVGLKVRF